MNIPHTQPSAEAQQEWSTGLFDCFSDFKNCCITCWCPCVTFGKIAEVVDKGLISCYSAGGLYTLLSYMGFNWLYSCMYRAKMRQQYMLRESPTYDWFVHCCCEPCALCQEYRELVNRGHDMTIGWRGNVDQLKHGATKKPTAEHMTR